MDSKQFGTRQQRRRKRFRGRSKVLRVGDCNGVRFREPLLCGFHLIKGFDVTMGFEFECGMLYSWQLECGFRTTYSVQSVLYRLYYFIPPSRINTTLFYPNLTRYTTYVVTKRTSAPLAPYSSQWATTISSRSPGRGQ